MIAAYLCVCKSKELYDLRYKSNKFQYTPNFCEWVLIEINSRNVFVPVGPMLVCFRNRHQYKVTVIDIV